MSISASEDDLLCERKTSTNFRFRRIEIGAELTLLHHQLDHDHCTKLARLPVGRIGNAATLTAGRALKDIDGELSPKTEWAVVATLRVKCS